MSNFNSPILQNAKMVLIVLAMYGAIIAITLMAQ
jgi:hypothetical protein